MPVVKVSWKVYSAFFITLHCWHYGHRYNICCDLEWLICGSDANPSIDVQFLCSCKVPRLPWLWSQSTTETLPNVSQLNCWHVFALHAIARLKSWITRSRGWNLLSTNIVYLLSRAKRSEICCCRRSTVAMPTVKVSWSFTLYIYIYIYIPLYIYLYIYIYIYI